MVNEQLQIDVSIPAEIISSFELEVIYDKGKPVDAFVDGKRVNLFFVETLLDIISKGSSSRQVNLN